MCNSHTQLEIYQAFLEEVLRQTSEDHIDYRSLGSALETIQDLKMVGVCFGLVASLGIGAVPTDLGSVDL